MGLLRLGNVEFFKEGKILVISVISALKQAYSVLNAF